MTNLTNIQILPNKTLYQDLDLIEQARSQIGSKYLDGVISVLVTIIILNFLALIFYKYVEKQYPEYIYLYFDLVFASNIALNSIITLYIYLIK